MAQEFTLGQLDAAFIQHEVRIETRRRIKPEVAKVKLMGPFHDDEIEDYTGPQIYMPYVDNLAAAHGVWFLCPKCYLANNGPIGTHRVICWFYGRVTDDVEPKPGRWLPGPKSTGLDNLTFVPHVLSNSVLLTGGCHAHFFVTDGRCTSVT